MNGNAIKQVPQLILPVESLSPDQLKNCTSQDEAILARSGPIPPGRCYPYETGYGDFCFLDGDQRTKLGASHGIKCWRNEKLLQQKKITSNFPVETYRRPFRFMELPREIRNEIYKLIIKPICAIDGASFRISVHGWRRCRYRSTAYPKHYGRKSNYDIYPELIIPLEEEENIRNLSNTNSIVRKELAEVTWARSSIKIEYGSQITTLGQLLNDRPAIWSGIKRFSFGIGEFGYFPLPENFLQICDLMSSLLRLEQLSLFLTMEERDVEQFCDTTKEKPSWVKGIRGLIVTHVFRLHLFPRFDDETGFDDDEIWERAQSEFLEKYEKTLWDAICPDSLRPKEQPVKVREGDDGFKMI